jgi:hypothetical protein
MDTDDRLRIYQAQFGCHVMDCPQCRDIMETAMTEPTEQTAIVDQLCERGRRFYQQYTDWDEAERQVAELKIKLTIPDRP